MKQLVLPVGLDTRPSFENFVAGGNQALLACLERLGTRDGEPQVLIYGDAPRGKSHLLQAARNRATERGQLACYVALAGQAAQRPDALTGLEEFALICVDDLDAVITQRRWAEALFHLINAQRARGHALLLASRAHPQAMAISLPDLVSRLMWGPLFQVQRLDDVALAALVVQRAAARGFEVPPEVVNYLLTRCARDVGRLLEIVNKLDLETLAQQRKVTLPLLREVLGSTTPGASQSS
ncbi:MAG: DnaA regulatory inactivator Hda [Thiotrichales bacterium]